jgi:Tol biopolymer transport system component
MPLQPGVQLGPYKILAQAGAGGMGEVYKAADTRLNRTVAIKVLPEHFSDDAEMKQRFDREAQTIASLNHPNICTLYDVGRQDGAEFLVMEYLEGETLAARITRGPLPLDEALRVAVGIADALDKAHGKGVTHRDLKPGNVMLTATGAKLLDFGLAKLKQPAAPPDAQSPAAPSANTTTPGTILGTMQYMAPEQLEGREADARTDIFAFGATLYEMVSGKRAFEGKSKAHLIAAIVSADPDPLTKAQPGTPPALDFLVKRCLEKDPEERLQTAWDLLAQLRWIADGGAETGMPAPVTTRTWRQPAKLVLAAALLLAVAVGIPAFLNFRSAKSLLETRFLIPTPDMPVPEAAAISPDGHAVAYSARDAGSTFLFVRPIDTDTALKLPGTDGAGNLFWSPDSRSIAFFAGGRLKKVQASGGPPQNICDTPDMQGGTWNAQDIIVFASSKGLQRVTAVGGEPMQLAAPKDSVPQNPYFLPDGQHFLFTSASAQPSNAAIYAGSINANDTVRLVAAQSNAAYAEPGYLLYHREGTLYAQPFNPNRLALTGEAIRVADKMPLGASGAAAFSASRTGILIFRNNPPPPQTTSTSAPNNTVLNLPLVWLDRSGKKLDQLADAAGWTGVSLSPNGKRVAVHRHEADGGDVWIFEPGQAMPAKFTFDATQDSSAPVWTPDGTQLAFASHRNGKWGLYIKPADNSHNEELLTESDVQMTPMSWLPDGQTLVYWTSSAKTQGDVWALPLKGEKKLFPVLVSAADERNPQISPDGKWIAYSSNETGRSEVYVQPFPQGTKIQISLNGGVFPRWGSGGKELFFMNLISVGNVMASAIHVSGTAIQREDPKILFQTGYFYSPHSGGQYHPYAVSSDGQRFLVPQIDGPIRVFTGRGATTGINAATVLREIVVDRHAATSPASTGAAPINVVLNWTAALKEN